MNSYAKNVMVRYKIHVKMMTVYSGDRSDTYINQTMQ